jgi:prophage tail gpP-like protein
MKRVSSLSAVLLAAVATTLMSTGIAEEQALYTWVDADGTVHYSDTPDDPRARKLALGSRRTDLGRVKSELDSVDADREARAEAAAQAEKEAEESAREEAARAQRCRQAEARMRTLMVARRPFRVDENGQQLYLTDGQITEERSAAQQAINEHCN